jgi:hypothetical protein
VLAEFMRGVWKMTTGADLQHLSDTEILDGTEYQIFPNTMPWTGVGVPVVYRFLPRGNDPGQCWAELFVLYPHPEGEPMPAAPPMRIVADDETWSSFAELTWLGPVFDQDHQNLLHIQKGLKTLPRDGVTMSAYQESRIRHYHSLIEEYIDG